MPGPFLELHADLSRTAEMAPRIAGALDGLWLFHATLAACRPGARHFGDATVAPFEPDPATGAQSADASCARRRGDRSPALRARALQNPFYALAVATAVDAGPADDTRAAARHGRHVTGVSDDEAVRAIRENGGHDDASLRRERALLEGVAARREASRAAAGGGA